MWDWHEEQLNQSTARFNVAAESKPLSWAEVLALWTDSPSFTEEFCRVLADCPFNGFRWETPPLRRRDLDEPFEFVLVDDPDLPDHPDPSPFMEHFRRAGNTSVVRFTSLGGDADLVVPTPVAEDEHYAQLSHFIRGAPRSQQRDLWHEVGLTMERRVDDRPVWLNTAGSGVAWLHVRLDERPKYYAYTPYKRFPSN